MCTIRDYRSKMLLVNIILVLFLSPHIVMCKMVVTPDLLTPIKQLNEVCGYDACPIPLSEYGVNVHIVPHTHYEMGYVRTFSEHYSGRIPEAPLNQDISTVSMKRTLDAVITELWGSEIRRFTLSDMPYFFHWWSQRDENVRRMVYTLIRQGRLTFVGGSWSMNDEATTNYHAIIDNFTYTLRKINATFWECGRPLVAWQADVMGHSKEFASLTAQMGFDALFINPISFDDELVRMKRWGLEMLWRGSDDLGPQSDIFTHKLFDGYWTPPGFCFSSLCLDPLLVTSDAVFNNVDERAKAFIDSMYNRQGSNYNSSHVMVVMGMLFGYHDAPYWFSNIDTLIKAVNDRAGQGKKDVYAMYSNPACYAKAVRDSGMPLETKQDDFFPMAYDEKTYLTGLYTTSPSIKLIAREIMIYLQMCKQMRVFAEIGPHHNSLFEELNWVMGAFQDHSIITGYSQDNVKSYYVEKAYMAVQRSTILLREAWNKLRKCPDMTLYYRCSFNISKCHQIIGDNYFLLIQNVLAWPVTIPVRYPLQYFGEKFRVYDPKGNIVKSTVMKIPTPVLKMHSRVSTSNYEVVFIAKDLPPLGFKSYFIERVTATKRYKREDTKHLKEDPPTTNNKDTDQIKHDNENSQTKRNKDLPKANNEDTQRKYKKGRSRKKNKKADAQMRKRRGNPRKTKNIDEEKPEAKQRIPLIKNMNRKPNKKYLIRQSNPQIEDQSLLYDLEEADYDTAINGSTIEKGNVSMLLESDLDEMQQLDDDAIDRPGEVVENEAPAELQEVQTTQDEQTTTSKEPNLTKMQQVVAVEDQSTNKKEKYTTTILRNPAVTSQILGQLELPTNTSLNQNESVINDTNISQKDMNVSDGAITPHHWYEEPLDLEAMNDTINPKHWNKVSFKEMGITNTDVNDTIEPRHWNKVTVNEMDKSKVDVVTPQPWNKVEFEENDVINDTMTPRRWNEVTWREADIENETSTPQIWNKVPLKDLDGYRRVNNIYDTYSEMVPNRTPSPKPIVTPTPMYNTEFNKLTTNNILREDVTISGSKTDANKDINKMKEAHSSDNKIKKVEEERTVDNKQTKKMEEEKAIRNKQIKKLEEEKAIDQELIKQIKEEKAIDYEQIKKMEEEKAIDNKQIVIVDGENPIGDRREQMLNEELLLEPEEVVADTMPEKEPESIGEVPSIDAATVSAIEEYTEKNRITQEPPIAESDANDTEDTLDLRTVNKNYIENKYIRIIIDPATSKVSSVTLSNGVQMNLDIQFYYYASDDPEALDKMNPAAGHNPGSLVFRAMENTPIAVLDFLDFEVFKSDVVEEAHFIYSSWTSFVIRLYEESPVIEVEWMIGPIPVDDKLGKEVFIRYLTNLVHEGVFYTDSNGRQTIKRIRHLRPQFETMNPDPVAGNLYPVTSKISIEDLNSNVCFSVFVDRAQGGTSLADGEVDLMLNRRVLTDDSGALTYVNETEYEQGIIVRGKHHLYISRANHKPYKIFEKKFAKELLLIPQALVPRPDVYQNYTKQIWLNSINEVSFLKTKLPIGIHLLTLEDWTTDTFLLRLENYLEKNDTLRGRSKTVYIQNMFTNLYITHVRETTLGANRWMDERQQDKPTWPKKEEFVRSFNEFYGADKVPEFLHNEKDTWEPVVNFEKGIKLAPQQIRTFVCNFDYVEL